MVFQFKWLRRFVRRNTSPIPEDRAALWKRRLSFGYAILAWQALGFVAYMIYTGRNDWAKYYGYKSEADMKLSPAQHFAQNLNVNKGKIIRMSGFQRVEELDFDNTQTSAEEANTKNPLPSIQQTQTQSQ